MKLTKEDVLELLRAILGIAFIVLFIISMVAGVKACNEQNTEYVENLPPYKAYYGNFWISDTIYFYTYKVEGDRYLFYDENGSFITEFVKTDGYAITIEQKR